MVGEETDGMWRRGPGNLGDLGEEMEDLRVICSIGTIMLEESAKKIL